MCLMLLPVGFGGEPGKGFGALSVHFEIPSWYGQRVCLHVMCCRGQPKETPSEPNFNKNLRLYVVWSTTLYMLCMTMLDRRAPQYKLRLRTSLGLQDTLFEALDLKHDRGGLNFQGKEFLSCVRHALMDICRPATRHEAPRAEIVQVSTSFVAKI